MNELEQIIKNENYPDSQNIALAVAWIIINMKGTNVKILDMRTINSLSDYFILADAQNPILAESMSDDVTFHMKKFGKHIRGVEGHRTSNWTLIDLGSVMAHIFVESSREIYNLESLWPNAPRIEIPESFYFSSKIASPSPIIINSQNDGDEGYV
ncbi:MAG: ribosome silencing factor [Oligoflexia bacterium]|nr:ribosome silencing factor [Oligoflexia bacterium]